MNKHPQKKQVSDDTTAEGTKNILLPPIHHIIKGPGKSSFLTWACTHVHSDSYKYKNVVLTYAIFIRIKARSEVSRTYFM